MQGQNAINGQAWREDSRVRKRAGYEAGTQDVQDLCVYIQIVIGMPLRMAVATAVHLGKVVAHLGKAALGPGLLVAQISAAYLGKGVAYLGKVALCSCPQADLGEVAVRSYLWADLGEVAVRSYLWADLGKVAVRSYL